MHRSVELNWWLEAALAAIAIALDCMGMIYSAAIVYQLSYRWRSAQVETRKQCNGKQPVTVVLNVQYTLQAVVSSRKGAGSDLLTRDCAFNSIVQTTADEVTAFVATVCCEW